MDEPNSTNSESSDDPVIVGVVPSPHPRRRLRQPMLMFADKIQGIQKEPTIDISSPTPERHDSSARESFIGDEEDTNLTEVDDISDRDEANNVGSGSRRASRSRSSSKSGSRSRSSSTSSSTSSSSTSATDDRDEDYEPSVSNPEDYEFNDDEYNEEDEEIRRMREMVAEEDAVRRESSDEDDYYRRNAVNLEQLSDIEGEDEEEEEDEVEIVGELIHLDDDDDEEEEEEMELDDDVIIEEEVIVLGDDNDDDYQFDDEIEDDSDDVVDDDEGEEREEDDERDALIPRKRRKGPKPGAKRNHPQQRKKVVFYQEEHTRPDDPRPVTFRKLPISDKPGAKLKRTRVTRKLANAPIQQFHLAMPLTPLEEIEQRTLGETVETFLDASRNFRPPSEKFWDRTYCMAVEYNGTVKMFHFGKDMKKHSCKQKKLRFQKNWWGKHKRVLSKYSGFLPQPVEPAFRVQDDPLLYEQHFLNSPNMKSHMQMYIHRIKRRCQANRTDDDIIRDSAYFVRQFFLTKATISLRIQFAKEIPDCFAPPMLRCGYYPWSCQNRAEKMDYLKERYKEAQLEYLKLTYRSIAPHKGFKNSSISDEELYEFHEAGRHIHGFFLVWEAVGSDFTDANGTRPKKYLVDMFNFTRFPLFVEYERWESRLRVAFDRLIVYTLHLTEIIRTNRPVFDFLSRNPSLFQKLAMKECVYTMIEHEIQPASLANIGPHSFFNWAVRNSNDDFLSAFLIVCGGVKEMCPIEEYRFNQSSVELVNKTTIGYRNRISKRMTILRTPLPVSTCYVADYSKDGPVLTRTVMDEALKSVNSRCILDLNKPPLPPPGPAAQHNRRDFLIAFSRKELMQVRTKIYDFEYPDEVMLPKAPPAKRKPGRKKKCMLAVNMELHNFQSKMEASDIETDYEGFQSDEELMEDHVEPVLRRTTSSDSIFLDYSYGESLVNRLSWLHRRKVPRNPENTRKRKLRKLNRYNRKHANRFHTNRIDQENEVLQEECFHRALPITHKHASRTKTAMRNPSKFRSYNLPRVYGKGETEIVNNVYDCLSEVVNTIVAHELVSSRSSNELSLLMIEAEEERRLAFNSLVYTGTIPLPPSPYLCLEMMMNKVINGRYNLEVAKVAILNDLEAAMGPEWVQARKVVMPNPEKKRLEAARKEKEKQEKEKAEKRKKDEEIRRKAIEEEEKEKRHQEELYQLHQNMLLNKRNLKEKNPSVTIEEERGRQRVSALVFENRIKRRAEDKAYENAAREEAERKEKRRAEKEEQARKRKQERKRQKMLAKMEARSKDLKAEAKRLAAEEKKKKEEAEKARRALERRKQKKIEKERLAAEARRKEAERKEAERKAAEKKAAEEAQKKKEEEERRKLEALKKKEEEARKILEAIKKKEEEEKKKFEALMKKREEERRKAREKAKLEQKRKEKERREYLSDDIEVSLYDIATDLRKPIYAKARRAFHDVDVVVFLEDHDKNWFRDYIQGSSFTMEEFVDSLQTIHMLSEPPPDENDKKRKSLLQFAKCFHYKLMAPQTREWIFEFNVDHLEFTFTPEEDEEEEDGLSLSGVRSYRHFTPMRSFDRPHDVTVLESLAKRQKAIQEQTIRADFSFVAKETRCDTIRVFPIPLVERLNCTIKSTSALQVTHVTQEEPRPEEFKPSIKNEFWKQVALIQSRKVVAKEDIQKEMDKLKEIVTQNSSINPYERERWSIELLEVVILLLTGELPQLDTFSVRYDKSKAVYTKDNPICKEILDLLLFGSAILAEACTCKGDMRVLLQLDGMNAMRIIIMKIMRRIWNILLTVNVGECFKECPMITVLMELIRDIESQLYDYLTNKHSVDSSLMNKETDILKSGLLNVNRWEEVLTTPQVAPKKDFIYRVRSAVKWYEALRKPSEIQIPRIAEIIHERLNHGHTIPMNTDDEDEEVKPDYEEIRRRMKHPSGPKPTGDDIQIIDEIIRDERTILETSAYRSKDLDATGRPIVRRSESLDSMNLPIPTKLPDYNSVLLNVLWRAIERSYGNLRPTKNLLSYTDYGREHKRGKDRFHTILEIFDKDVAESRKSAFVTLRVEDDMEARDLSDGKVLSLFNGEIITERTFNEMRWTVRREKAEPRTAIDFFTNLRKFVGQKQKFLNEIKNNKLSITYKMYQHVWFMGGLRPPIVVCPDSHEDTPGFDACGGCTSGDIVLVHNCTCAYHNDVDRAVCHTFALRDTFGVKQLFGRFVCEHGPCSVLQFDLIHPTGKPTFVCTEARCAEIKTKMNIEDPETIFADLNRMFVLTETIMRLNQPEPVDGTPDSEEEFQVPKRPAKQSKANDSSAYERSLLRTLIEESGASENEEPSSGLSNTPAQKPMKRKSPVDKQSDNSSRPKKKKSRLETLRGEGTVTIPGRATVDDANGERSDDECQQTSPANRTHQMITTPVQSTANRSIGERSDNERRRATIANKANRSFVPPFQSLNNSAIEFDPRITSTPIIHEPRKRKLHDHRDSSYKDSLWRLKTQRAMAKLESADAFRRRICRIPFQTRCKSCERDKVGVAQTIKGLSRNGSARNLVELEKYADMKINRVYDKYQKANIAKSFKVNQKWPLEWKHKEEMHEFRRVLDRVGTEGPDSWLDPLFQDVMAVPNDNNRKSLKKPKCFNKIRSLGDTLHFHNDNKLVSGTSVSVVMNVFYKFEQFKKETLAKARLRTNGISVLKNRNTMAYNKLFTAYTMIFDYYVGLIEHLFNMVTRHIFNIYSVYEALTNESAANIENHLNVFKKSMPIILNCFFNTEPLRRQIDELAILDQEMKDEDKLRATVFGLAKQAIQHVRAPPNAPLNFDKYNKWLNSEPAFIASYDILVLNTDDFLPQDEQIIQEFKEEARNCCINLNDFEREMKKNHYSNQTVAAFMDVLFAQTDMFNKTINSTSLGGTVDPYIKAFYQHQTCLRMFSLFKKKKALTADDFVKAPRAVTTLTCATIFATPKLSENMEFAARMIDRLYNDICRHRCNAYIEPSRLGVMFIPKDKTIYFAAVHEGCVGGGRILEFNKETCMRDYEKSVDLQFNGGWLTLLVNTNTGMLSMIFKDREEDSKDDRLEIETIPHDFLYNTNGEIKVNWTQIVDNYFTTNKHNVLKKALDDFNSDEWNEWNNYSKEEDSDDDSDTIEQPEPKYRLFNRLTC